MGFPAKMLVFVVLFAVSMTVGDAIPPRDGQHDCIDCDISERQKCECREHLRRTGKTVAYICDPDSVDRFLSVTVPIESFARIAPVEPDGTPSSVLVTLFASATPSNVRLNLFPRQPPLLARQLPLLVRLLPLLPPQLPQLPLLLHSHLSRSPSAMSTTNITRKR